MDRVQDIGREPGDARWREAARDDEFPEGERERDGRSDRAHRGEPPAHAPRAVPPAGRVERRERGLAIARARGEDADDRPDQPDARDQGDDEDRGAVVEERRG